MDANLASNSICAVSNLYVRMMRFDKKGDIEPGHSHVHDHLTLLAKGSLKVTVDGVVSEFKAPHMIYIKKEKQHELIALEDDTLTFCVFALRDINTNELLDPDSIPEGVNPTTLAEQILCCEKE